MSSEIFDALMIIAKEKGIDFDYLLSTLEEGILTAAQKKYQRAPHVEVRVDRTSGEISLVVHKRVSKVAWDTNSEIDLDEALEIDPDVRDGDVVPVEVPVEEFGRNAVYAVKQSITQNVRDAERKNIHDEFAERVGQIVTGTVQQVDRREGLILRLGRAEGRVPPSEMVRRSRPKIGDHVRALIVEVVREGKGPQIILSQTRPEFVIKLFEQEVPEVYERIVEIKGIAREPGARTKIAVISHDDRVDPVGACVGVKGSRVQNIVKSLGGERIDIVALSADPLIYVSRALSPARVLSVSFMGDPKIVRAVVPDDQLSLAIGKGAQNVRLAGQLTGLEIQLISQSQQESLEGRPEGDELELESLTREFGPRLVERMMRAGKETLQDVLATPIEELMEIPGIGEKTASKLVTIGAQILDQWTAQREAAQQAAAEEQEAPEAATDEEGEEAPAEPDATAESEAMPEVQPGAQAPGSSPEEPEKPEKAPPPTDQELGPRSSGEGETETESEGETEAAAVEESSPSEPIGEDAGAEEPKTEPSSRTSSSGTGE
ncbi:MAG: transcription termination/antitermination protein NusA [Candidatus Eisenbacteria bacterium]|nr:transcription termination/antitermination protein NusA [Candidatus Eisenbacteria bacterium]